MAGPPDLWKHHPGVPPGDVKLRPLPFLLLPGKRGGFLHSLLGAQGWRQTVYLHMRVCVCVCVCVCMCMLTSAGHTGKNQGHRGIYLMLSGLHSRMLLSISTEVRLKETPFTVPLVAQCSARPLCPPAWEGCRQSQSTVVRSLAPFHMHLGRFSHFLAV